MREIVQNFFFQFFISKFCKRTRYNADQKKNTKKTLCTPKGDLQKMQSETNKIEQKVKHLSTQIVWQTMVLIIGM